MAIPQVVANGHATNVHPIILKATAKSNRKIVPLL
jgi:hypothetical protein